MSQPKAKRARTQLTFGQKKEICEHQRNHKKLSQSEIAKHFSNKWNQQIARNTISDILKDTTKWLSIDSESKDTLRPRVAKYEQLEKALLLWLNDKTAQNARISDLIITIKAKEFEEKMNIKDFNYSSG